MSTRCKIPVWCSFLTSASVSPQIRIPFEAIEDFSLKISNKVYLHDDLDVQFVHHVRMSSLNCIMYQHRYLPLMSISKSLSEMLDI